ncbi:MAG: hypothetical protein GYA24_01025 [Candidatus Lokiarchaeota archaeon]|nr:hypothetical protein [Candidatus Lokiarchaeota archaeon]
MAGKNTIQQFFSGTLSKQAMLARLLPSMLAIMLGGLFVASIMYPDVYDWRYLVISRLLDSEDNPGWSAVLATCMAIAGFLMISFLGYYQKKLGKICRGSTGFGTAFMLVACIGLIGVGTIGQFELGIQKLHEYLAALGFLGVFLASIFYACPVLKDQSKGAKQFNMRRFWAGMIPLIIGVAGLALSALYNELNGFNYASNPHLDDVLVHGFFALHSFAFWEWILFVGVIVYLVVFLSVVPENVIPFEPRP